MKEIIEHSQIELPKSLKTILWVFVLLGAVASVCPPRNTFHKGQDNRTNIPKRDTDGSDQSSHSTL